MPYNHTPLLHSVGTESENLTRMIRNTQCGQVYFCLVWNYKIDRYIINKITCVWEKWVNALLLNFVCWWTKKWNIKLLIYHRLLCAFILINRVFGDLNVCTETTMKLMRTCKFTARASSQNSMISDHYANCCRIDLNFQSRKQPRTRSALHKQCTSVK